MNPSLGAMIAGFFLGALFTLGATLLLLIVVTITVGLWEEVGHSVAITFALVIIAGGAAGGAAVRKQ